MTLKELIMQVSFDELLPCLKTLISGNEGSLYAFRETYDWLRLKEADSAYKGTIHVGWCGDEEDRWIGVSNMHNASWEKNLAKEIAVDDDVQISADELAAHCLWKITFYGFSPAEEIETFNRMFGRDRAKSMNKYDLALKKLKASIWMHQTPRKYRCTFRGMQCGDWRTIEYHRRLLYKKNRPKRMREHRQKRRKEYLEKMSARTNMVDALIVPGSSFVRSDVDFLFTVSYGIHYDYISMTGGAEGRLAYIADSMRFYQPIDVRKYDNAIVCVSHSSRYPLKEEEIGSFKEFICSHLKYSDIRFGTIVTDGEEKEVKMSLLLSKLKA